MFAIREKLENFALFFAKRLRNLKGLLVTSERAQRAERVLSNLREKSEYSLPGPTRPGPITLFKV